MEKETSIFLPRKIPAQIASVAISLTPKALRDSAPKKPGVCPICSNKVKDQSIEVSGKLYHKDCFSCDLCLEPILTNTFQIVDGHPLHNYCSSALRGTFCATCSQPIIGSDVVFALESPYHPGCLHCSLCQRVIGPNEKIESCNGVPLCYDCFRKNNRVCLRCAKTVPGSVRPFLHGGCAYFLHKTCATCKLCGAALTQRNFVQEQGEALCTRCWFKIGRYVCVCCGDPILPADRLVFNGHRHTRCFRCHNCRISLMSENPSVLGDLLLCRRCASGADTHCAVCFQLIDEQKVEAFGRSFHPKCFRCAVCKKQPSVKEAIFKNGKLSCMRCAHIHD